jgi:hypothetical protein
MVLSIYKLVPKTKFQKAIGSFIFVTALMRLATDDDTGDYALWVAKTKVPPQWHTGLDEENVVVPAKHHNAE